MHLADMLITSAGRTVFEAAAVGVPTIVLAQNVRETTHTHLGLEHGNIYLGLGKLVTDQTIVDTVRLLSNDIGLRTELSGQGRPDGKGLDRILWTIDGLIGGL
jgi:spore coat polysaccharide biosynthesis predicted glycosyltransferase SpsG